MSTTRARAMKPWARAVITALGREPDVVVGPGWGEGNVVLTREGTIFAILSENRFVVKLPKPRVDELVARRLGTRFDPRKNGRVMKEWLVSTARRGRTALAREAYRFVADAPTKRKARR